MKKIRIYIDQGHNPGTINAGASANGLYEADITYNVGAYLADMLSADDRFEVKTSRTYPEQVLGYDTPSSLAARVNEANDWPADYFISIHVNYNENPNIHGTEVYVYRQYSQAWYLAQDVLDSIVEIAGTSDNLVRVNPSLYVLRRTAMPAILVELGYLTNPEDAQKLRDDQYQFAEGIYAGILRYFDFV